MPESLTDSTFFQAMEGPASLVLFRAEWSGPSHSFSALLDESAHAFPDLRFFQMDFDECQQLAQQHGVTLIPALLAFSGGREVARLQGLVPPAYLKSWLEAL